MYDATASDQEPDLRISTNETVNESRRRRRRRVNGRVVIERVPQVAPGAQLSQRCAEYVRDNGSTVNMVLTCAAAHLDPDDSYGRYMQRKARHYGWFRLDKCPCTLLKDKQLLAEQIVDKEILAGQPCDADSFGPGHPCPHALAERDARSAVYTARETERMKAYQSEADKHHRESVDTQRETNAQLTEMVQQLVKLQMAQAQSAPAATPTAPIPPAPTAAPKATK